MQTIRRLLFPLLFMALFPSFAHAYGKVQGWCQDGGVRVNVPGGTGLSTNANSVTPSYFQRSYPSCTVTVYLTGTVTVATIYSDDAGTAKANPFTAASTGQWFFYAADGRYDVRFSAGGIPTPFTLGDMFAWDTARPSNIRVPCDPEFTAATEGASISLAITDLPATGGTVDARCFQGAGSWAVDFFSGVTKPVTLIVGSGTKALSANMTVPANVTMQHPQGAIIAISNSITLNIRGFVDAGIYKIYEDSNGGVWAGSGAVKFAPTAQGSRNNSIYPEWFGATDSGVSTDDSSYIQAAFNSLNNSGEGIPMPVKFRKAEYCVGTALTALNIKIYGEGEGTALLTNTGGCADMGAADFLTINAGGRLGFEMRGIQIKSNGEADSTPVTSTQNYGIVINDAHFWTMEQVHIRGFTKSGFGCLRVVASFTGEVYGLLVEHCDRGIENVRVGEASGGVSYYGVKSGEIISFGIRNEASTGVGCYNCELNVYGSAGTRGTGVYVSSSASVIAEAYTHNGGYIVAGNYGIQIGAAGMLSFKGVEISGVSIDGCVASPGPCILGADAASAGIFIQNGGIASGVHIAGTTIEGFGSGVRTSGAIVPGDFQMDAVVVGANGLIAPSAFINQNGTELTDTDGAAIDGKSFSSGACMHVFVTGTTSNKCGYSVMRVRSDYTAVGNVGGGADVLMTWQIPAGFFTTNRTLYLEFWGDTAANGNNKTITCYWGTHTIATFGPTAANARDWTISATILGASAAAQVKAHDMLWNNAMQVNDNTSFSGNISDARNIYCEGTGTADNDIVQRAMIVRLDP